VEPPAGLPGDEPAPTSATRGSGLTVRTRILAAVLALAAFGLMLAGSTAYLLLRERADDRIDENLNRSVQEFRALAADGVDPRTGKPFATASDLVYIAIQRTVPPATAGVVGLVAGEIRWTQPSSVQLRPEKDPELVSRLERIGINDHVQISGLTTRLTDYRYVAVPVRVVGDPSTAVLVFVHDRRAEHAELTATYRTYGAVSLASLLLIGVVGWVVAGRLLAPLRLLGATARRITDSDLSDRIPTSGHDDVSELTRTVNAMLDRLETAFDSQRLLLDDAGHELRTPLTILRGHLELLDPADASDTSATRALALDEVDRMHRLVEDLVTLAKADRPDFVRLAPVDIGRLTDDVLDKARTLGQRRWSIDERTEVTGMLDAQRITQALLQLAANAVKFSADGTTIAVGSAVRDGRIRLWVRDQGQGVSPEDSERIFERFARGRAGRGVEGSGLGLPIVTAIAEAHGGTILLDSRPGHGSTFTLDLPTQNQELP
jgi:two-component system OmpR family sensor kinase